MHLIQFKHWPQFQRWFSFLIYPKLQNKTFIPQKVFPVKGLQAFLLDTVPALLHIFLLRSSVREWYFSSNALEGYMKSDAFHDVLRYEYAWKKLITAYANYSVFDSSRVHRTKTVVTQLRKPHYHKCCYTYLYIYTYLSHCHTCSHVVGIAPRWSISKHSN